MRKVLALVVVLVVLGAACGDDDDDSTSTGAEAPVTLSGKVNDKGQKDLGSDGELELEADDFYFKPTFVKAEPGKKLEVKIENEGDNTHTFTIDSANVDVEIKSGDDGSAEVTVPDSGALRFYCRFHSGQGMQGAIYTKDGDTVVSGSSGSGGSGGTSTTDTTDSSSGGTNY